MVGCIKEHISKKYNYEVLCTDGSYSMKTPVVLLVGRIINIKGNPYPLSIASPSKVEGVQVIDSRTIHVDYGYTVEVGTGGSPLGWIAERKIFIDGPVTLTHGQIVTDFEEANEPEDNLVARFGEGHIMPRGQLIPKGAYPELTTHYANAEEISGQVKQSRLILPDFDGKFMHTLQEETEGYKRAQSLLVEG